MGALKVAIFCGVLAYVIYVLRTPQASQVVNHVNDTYDYVIVGAGSAGCVLASRLSEDPDVSVLLMEAGGEETENSTFYDIPLFAFLLQQSPSDWEYYTVPQTQSGMASMAGGNRHYWPRGKVFMGLYLLRCPIY